MKKIVLPFLIIINSFACVCHPSVSCIPVKISLGRALAIGEKGVIENDGTIFAKKIKEIKEIQKKISLMQNEITSLQKKISAIKKIEALYSDNIAKEMLKKNNLEFLLNRQIYNLNQSYSLLNKMELLNLKKGLKK